MGIQSVDIGQGLLLAPVIWVALTGLAALLGDLFIKGRTKVSLAYISLTGLGVAAYFIAQNWVHAEPQYLLGGTICISSFSAVAGFALLGAAALTSLNAAQYAKGTAVATGEFHALTLFATAGAMVLVVANDMVTFFVALETMSLSVYALTGITRGRSTSAEGAMKYFIVGALASAFLVYGSGLIYAASGSLQFFAEPGAEVTNAIAVRSQNMEGHFALVGLTCVVVALLFKVGAVPFHGWVTDAYQGAPAPSTGFMSVAVKTAAFIGFMRLVLAVGHGAGSPIGVSRMLWAVATLTMIVGNFGALMQTNPKRMLGYSGIAHTGYALVALVALARTQEGGQFHDQELIQQGAMGVLYYMLAYTFTNLIVFAALSSLERQGQDVERIEDLSGLARRSPLTAFAMMVGLLSLAGIPMTGGFIGKVMVFVAGVKAHLLGLVLLGLITSIVSLYYYLRIIVVMYMKPTDDGSASLEDAGDRGRWTARLAMVVGTIIVLLLGLAPMLVSGYVAEGAAAFTRF